MNFLVLPKKQQRQIILSFFTNYLTHLLGGFCSVLASIGLHPYMRLLRPKGMRKLQLSWGKYFKGTCMFKIILLTKGRQNLFHSFCYNFYRWKQRRLLANRVVYVELWQKVRRNAKILNSRFGMPNSSIHDFRMPKSLNHDFGMFKSWFQNPECMILTFKNLLIQDFSFYNYYFMSKLYKYNSRNSHPLSNRFRVMVQSWSKAKILNLTFWKAKILNWRFLNTNIFEFRINWTPKSRIQDFGTPKSLVQDL